MVFVIVTNVFSSIVLMELIVTTACATLKPTSYSAIMEEKE